MHAFRSQVFILLKKLLKKVEAKCKAFLWVGSNLESRKAPIAWDKVYQPHFFGGLGLKNMLVWNKLSLMKQLWNIVHKKGTLWLLWVHEYYIKNRSIRSMKSPVTASWMFKKSLIKRMI